MSNVVFVDDDKDIISVYEFIFDDYKHVKFFTSAIEALKFIRFNQVDLILSDYNMPFVSGLDLYHMIRDFDKFVSFHLLSANEPILIREDPLYCDSINIMTKPIEIETLIELVDEFS